MQASDVNENEQIIFSCPECKVSRSESAREFFIKVSSLRLLPKITCKQCGTQIDVSLNP